ncbi:MAG: hypothetical protein IID51_02125 [Proteobacteria bacterium]|nr:hypothetical protein [Pseudomonadota bacterium]
MIKLFVAVICVAALFSSKATADEANTGAVTAGAESATTLTREVTRDAIQETNQGAMREVLLCRINKSCSDLSDEDRARAAVALLFLRISENCNRQPCALRLARSR